MVALDAGIRLRRKLTQAMVAERVGVSLPTIRKLESSDPSTSLATVMRVLQVLGLSNDIDALAAEDAPGRQLQDLELKRPRGRRPPATVLTGRGRLVTSVDVMLDDARATFKSDQEESLLRDILRWTPLKARTMHKHLAAALLGVFLSIGMEYVAARDFTIGDRVICDGATGTIVRTQPRTGWNEPFSIVRLEGAGAGQEYRCLQARMRAAPGHSEAVSTPGAGAAPVSSARGPDQPRERGNANIGRPVNPGADTRARATAGSTVPDGNYRCHKISPGGQLMDIGDLEVTGGRATVRGMPETWVVRSVSLIGKNARGQLLVAVDYTSAAGWNDRLDCEAR